MEETNTEETQQTEEIQHTEVPPSSHPKPHSIVSEEEHKTTDNHNHSEVRNLSQPIKFIAHDVFYYECSVTIQQLRDAQRNLYHC